MIYLSVVGEALSPVHHVVQVVVKIVCLAFERFVIPHRCAHHHRQDSPMASLASNKPTLRPSALKASANSATRSRLAGVLVAL